MTFRDGVNKGEAYFDWTTYTYVDPNAGNTTGLNDGVITSADIMQINNYYPFGLNMEGNWNGSQGGNKYQYNGKEWNDDFGLGWNHHDWRFLDVAINRFVTIDRLPEEEEQEQLSPYQFGYDNPIRYDDPDGQCPTCLIGAILGGAVEYGGQVLTNLSEGKTLKESLTDIDVADVGFAMAEGALTSGGSVVRRAIVKTVISVGAEIAENTFDVKINDGKIDVKVNSAKNVAKNTVVGLVAGKLGDKLPAPKAKVFSSSTPKQAVKQARSEGQKITKAKRQDIEKVAKKKQKDAKEMNEGMNKLGNKTAAEAVGEKTKRKTD